MKPAMLDHQLQSSKDLERNRVTIKMMKIQNGYTISDAQGKISAFTGDSSLEDALNFIEDLFTGLAVN